jgi:hypothetical protein
MWLVLVRIYALPRDHHVQVLLDVSRLTTLRNNYVVSLVHAGATLGSVSGLTSEQAFTQAEEFRDAILETTSLKAVLARCMRKVEMAGAWLGSPAELAARQFGLGTWQWVQMLQAYRQIQESRKAA